MHYFKRPWLAGMILSACFLLPAAPQTISPEDAAKHVGERAKVCGSIAGEHTATSSRGTPTFINLDKPYPDQVFTILVWGSDRSAVGALPTSGRICAVGTISEYRGVPEIVLRARKDWFTPEN